MASVKQSPGIFVREIDNTISIQRPGAGGIGISVRLNKGPIGKPIYVNSERELLDKGGRPIPGFNLVSWHSVDNILLYTGNVMMSRVEHLESESSHTNSNRIFTVKVNNAQIGLCLSGDSVKFNYKNESRGMINNRTDFASVNSTNANDIIGDEELDFSTLDNSMFVDNDDTVDMLTEDSAFNLKARNLKIIETLSPKQVEYSTLANITSAPKLERGDVYNSHGKINAIGHDIYDDFVMIDFAHDDDRDFSALSGFVVNPVVNPYLVTVTSADFGANGTILESGNVVKIVQDDAGTITTFFREIEYASGNTFVVTEPFLEEFVGTIVMTFVKNALTQPLADATILTGSYDLTFRDFSPAQLSIGTKLFVGNHSPLTVTAINGNTSVTVDIAPTADLTQVEFAYSFGEIEYASVAEGDILYTPDGTVEVISKHADTTHTSKQRLIVKDIDARVSGGDLIAPIPVSDWKNFKSRIVTSNTINKSNNEYFVKVNAFDGIMNEERLISGKAIVSNGQIVVPSNAISSALVVGDTICLVQDETQYYREVLLATDDGTNVTIDLIANGEIVGNTTNEFLLYKTKNAATPIEIDIVNVATDGLSATFVDTGAVESLITGGSRVLVRIVGATDVNIREVVSYNAPVLFFNKPLSNDIISSDFSTIPITMSYFATEETPSQDLVLGSLITMRGYTFEDSPQAIGTANLESFTWAGEAKVLFKGLYNNERYLLIELTENTCESIDTSILCVGEDSAGENFGDFKSKLGTSNWANPAGQISEIINYEDVLVYEFNTLINYETILIVNEDVSELRKGIEFRYTYIPSTYEDYSKVNDVTGQLHLSSEFLRVVAVTPGAWFNTDGYKIAVCDMSHLDDELGIPSNTTSFRDMFDYIDESDKSQLAIVILDKDNYVAEKYIVSIHPESQDDDGLSAYLPEVINKKSTLVRMFINTATFETEGPTAYDMNFNTIQLVDIDGGYSSLKYEIPRYAYNKERGSNFTIVTTNNYITDEDVIVAYDIFREKDDIDLTYLVDGEWAGNKSIQHRMIDICYTRHDSIAILGPNKNDVIGYRNKESVENNLVEYAMTNNPLTTANQASQFGAFFGNYKQIKDPFNNVDVWIPISIDVVGLNAYVDNYYDPWHSTAGLKRGVLKNVVKLAWNPNEGNRDGIYKAKINPVVNFKGEGNLIWGVRSCYALKSDLGDIYNRKTLNYIEKNLQAMLRVALFEMNDAVTRNQVVAIIEPFLKSIQARRGLIDYKIVCDTSNNPPSVVEENTLVADIFLKMAHVVEYIELNFIMTKASAEFTES